MYAAKGTGPVRSKKSKECKSIISETYRTDDTLRESIEMTTLYLVVLERRATLTKEFQTLSKEMYRVGEV